MLEKSLSADNKSMLVRNLFFLFIGLAFLSCSTGKETAAEGSSPSLIDSSKTYISYSKRFEVNFYSNYKTLHVFSDRNNHDTTFSYVLYKRGTEKPKVKFKAQYIAVPVNRVACMSSLYVGCLDKFGLLDKIVAVDNADYLNNAYVLNKIAKGEIKELSKEANINVEQTLLVNPELIISFGMGNPEKDMNKKIVDAGIPVAISIDHLETSPLARAEWMKFVALFFNAEQKADSVFNDIKKKYAELERLTAGVKYRPTVLTELKYGDTWFVPGGKSFMAALLSDAGADYTWKDDGQAGSLQLSFEEVYKKASGSEYWLNLLFCNSKKDVVAQDKRYADFAAYKNNKLYNNNAVANAKGFNAYWETGLISPNEVLADLISIFHPELLPGHKLKYYKRLE
ncbi:MAG: ABC transporter substrate-binding protein [Bacteroidia bacterium]